jgi:hypothetical protein
MRVQDKTVLVEPSEDFTLCEVVREVAVLRPHSTTSLFPVIEAQFRWGNLNCTYRDRT